MNSKVALFGIGAALVSSIAIPISVSSSKSKAESSHDQKNKKPKSLVGLPKRAQGAQSDYYMSKYQGYFLNHNDNKELWDSKFSKYKKSNPNYISVLARDTDSKEEVARITKPWAPYNKGTTYEEQDLPLNVFCARGYEEAGDPSMGIWTFDIMSNTIYPLVDPVNFWQLCSSFDNKPKTVLEEGWETDSKPYEHKLGERIYWLIVSVNGNDDFWNQRQEEWESENINDSDHFAKTSGKKIRDLCREAYEKDLSTNPDSNNLPTLYEVVKYCSIEWNFYPS